MPLEKIYHLHVHLVSPSLRSALQLHYPSANSIARNFQYFKSDLLLINSCYIIDHEQT
jgi:hypothetical protein